jgi:tetratricopeptide (TPR) repeat protein
LLERLVQQHPERLELRLQLAQLYELTGQVLKAETAYDQVLAQQNNNLKALVGKAVLRKVQGDIKTAEALFAQAEKVAPTDLKAQVRATAQKTLASSAKPIPATK